jgi:hypothetical protein
VSATHVKARATLPSGIRADILPSRCEWLRGSTQCACPCSCRPIAEPVSVWRGVTVKCSMAPPCCWVGRANGFVSALDHAVASDGLAPGDIDVLLGLPPTISRGIRSEPGWLPRRSRARHAPALLIPRHGSRGPKSTRILRLARLPAFMMSAYSDAAGGRHHRGLSRSVRRRSAEARRREPVKEGRLYSPSPRQHPLEGAHRSCVT